MTLPLHPVLIWQETDAMGKIWRISGIPVFWTWHNTNYGVP